MEKYLKNEKIFFSNCDLIQTEKIEAARHVEDCQSSWRRICCTCALNTSASCGRRSSSRSRRGTSWESSKIMKGWLTENSFQLENNRNVSFCIKLCRLIDALVWMFSKWTSWMYFFERYEDELGDSGNQSTAGQTRARSSGCWPIWEVQEKLWRCLGWTTTQWCSPGGRSSPSSKVSRNKHLKTTSNRFTWSIMLKIDDFERLITKWLIDWIYVGHEGNSWNHYRQVDETLIGWFGWFMNTWFRKVD